MTEEKRYKGEIIAERRRNLDFSLEFSKVCMGLTAGAYLDIQEKIG